MLNRADVSDTLTVSLSTSSTESETKTSEESWTVDNNIVTAAGQTQSVQIIINTQQTSASFSYSYSFSGMVPIWCEGGVMSAYELHDDVHR